MTDLRSLKKHVMFLTLKRDLAVVSLFFFLLSVSIISSYFSLLLFLKKTIQAMHIAEELVSNSHEQMKEEEGWRITAVKAFTTAK